MEWKLFGLDLEKLATRRGRLTAREISPTRDWLLLLVATAVLLIAMAAYDTSVLLEVNRGIEQEPVEPQRSSFDEAAFDTLLSDYRDRERAYQELRFTPVTLPDPSI